jgi:1-acyl-sn-glycerol-3-phosphate acyltransferase
MAEVVPLGKPGRSPRRRPVRAPRRQDDPVAEALSFLRRRLTGDYEVDEFGYDPDLTQNALAPLARLLHERWWRVDWVAMENVPAEGPAMLVANHAGTLPWDAIVLKFGVLDRHPARRHVRLLAADLVFRMPFVGALARKSGNTLACDEDALRLLERDEVLGVFPEGYKGVGKQWRERYRLQRFGRGGFMELALRARAPIVPVAIVGSEEIYPLVSRARPLARVFGLPYFPITPLFPWLGPLGLIPLPSKWIVEFGEPIATDEYPRDAWQDGLTVLDLTERVREEIQAMLQRNLVARKSVFR